MRGWFARKWASNQAKCRNHDESRRFVEVTLPLMTASLILGHFARKSSLSDAWNAVFMRARMLTEIYSWDTDFDALAWLTRIEPQEDNQ